MKYFQNVTKSKILTFELSLGKTLMHMAAELAWINANPA